MNQKQKEILFSTIKDNLGNIVGASGQPEELVRLTTAVVQGTKRLIEGVPENLSASSTSALTAFVLCAKSVAKNPRGVDGKVIQQLSFTRSEVERNVKELEKWHLRSRSPLLEDLAGVMDSISKPQENRTSPEADPEPKNLTWDLQRKRDALLLKMDPQKNYQDPIDDPQEVMATAVQGLMKGADELTKHCEGKLPSKDTLLESMMLVVDMVCQLLDLVDSLFVSKYPMRSQVYSFCSALIDNVLAFGCRTKSDDILSLRNISTQTPALLNASKVMVEQCEIRLSSVRSKMDMSIMRTKELNDVVKDGITPVAKKRTKASVAPTLQPKPEPKQEFEVFCMVCTNVAVDQKTQQPLSRGTELKLTVSMTTTVKDIKQDLASRTGILFDSIQLNQGQEELPDSVTINPNSPLPYFLFNRDEPTEEERLQKRKDERQKNKLTLDNLDWSKVTKPVAVAVIEYDTLGDERSLAFDERDIIEILEKSADGWWEGRSGDKVGTFPASFVREINSIEEGIKLFESSKQGGRIDEGEVNDNGYLEGRSSDTNVLSSHSPKPFSKKKRNALLSRGTSSPEFSSFDIPKAREGKEKGLGAIFQKKKKSSGYINLTVYNEVNEEERVSPIEPAATTSKLPSIPKPLFKPRRSFGSNSGIAKSSVIARPPRVLGDDLVDKKSQSRSTSPKEVTSDHNTTVVPKPQNSEKKRAPPPRPQPFAQTHPTQAAKLDAIFKAQTSIDENNEKRERSESDTLDFSTKSKNSNSMEDLLKNLQDFEEAEIDDNIPPSVTGTQITLVEYETCERPKTPPKIVETIKISNYKSNSDTHISDDDGDDGDGDSGDSGDSDEEIDALGKDNGLLMDKHNLQQTKDVTSFDEGSVQQTDGWNPREWTPSPEPLPSRPARKLPSWSFDVNSSSHSSKENLHSSMVTNSISKETSNVEKPKSVAPPKLMSRPRRSVSGSPRVTPTVSPKTTPSVSPKTTPAGSPSLPHKSNNLPVVAQKPVAPPRTKKKPAIDSISKENSAQQQGRRAPVRAPPPPPSAYKQPVTNPLYKSEIDKQASKTPSNSSVFQRSR